MAGSMSEAPTPAANGSVHAPRRTAAIASGVLALAAAATTLTAGFLPVIQVSGDGSDVGFFACSEVPGCSWLGLWLIAVSLGLAAGGLLMLVRGELADLGAALVAAALIGGLGFLGWAGFVESNDELGVSLGSGPIVGIMGAVVGLAAGIVAIIGRMPGPTGRPQQSGAERDRRSRLGPVAPTLGVAAAIGVVASVYLPYLHIRGQGDLSIGECGSAGCGWFVVEPFALAIVLVILSGLGFANVISNRVAVVAFALAGGWAAVLFVGYVGYTLNPDAFGGGSDAGPAGWIGLGAGALAIVAAGIAFAAVKREARAPTRTAQQAADDRLI